MCLVTVLPLEKSAFLCSDKISVFTFPDCAISGHTAPSAAARKYILPALSVEVKSLHVLLKENLVTHLKVANFLQRLAYSTMISFKMRRKWPSERTWWKGLWVRITLHFALSCFLKFKDTAKAAQVEAVQLSLLFRVRCAGHAAVKDQADEKFFTTCDLVINLRPDSISTP